MPSFRSWLNSSHQVTGPAAKKQSYNDRTRLLARRLFRPTLEHLENRVVPDAGALPTSATFDSDAFTASQTQQQFDLADPSTGTYYVGLRGLDAAGTGQTFALSGEAVGFESRTINPASGSNAGRAAVTVNGSGFSSATTVAVPAINLVVTGTNTLSVADSSTGKVLVGGSGRDSFTGGTGRDILIGGAGPDTLHAGSGGDVLIAGSTAFDANPTTLAALMAEWSSDDSYLPRVQDPLGLSTEGRTAARSWMPQRSSRTQRSTSWSAEAPEIGSGSNPRSTNLAGRSPARSSARNNSSAVALWGCRISAQFRVCSRRTSAPHNNWSRQRPVSCAKRLS